jgi:hypothetical protein
MRKIIGLASLILLSSCNQESEAVQETPAPAIKVVKVLPIQLELKRTL